MDGRKIIKRKNSIFNFETKPLLFSAAAAAAAAKSLQSCPILCDPIPGILQARTLDWVDTCKWDF